MYEALTETRPRRHCEEQRDDAIHVSTSGQMDCFAEPVIGRAFARPVGSQSRPMGRLSVMPLHLALGSTPPARPAALADARRSLRSGRTCRVRRTLPPP